MDTQSPQQSHGASSLGSPHSLGGTGMDGTVQHAGGMRPRVEYADPAQIQWDPEEQAAVAEPGFWEQHSRTKQDYIELTQGVREVQDRLDAGQSMSEIKEDSRLHSSATQYFDPNYAVRVNRTSDGLVFAGKGRHRLAAAKELGMEIPVRVNGEYMRQDLEVDRTQGTLQTAAGAHALSNQPQGQVGTVIQPGSRREMVRQNIEQVHKQADQQAQIQQVSHGYTKQGHSL